MIVFTFISDYGIYRLQYTSALAQNAVYFPSPTCHIWPASVHFHTDKLMTKNKKVDIINFEHNKTKKNPR